MLRAESEVMGNLDGKTLVLPSRSLCLADDKENNYNIRSIWKLAGGYFLFIML